MLVNRNEPHLSHTDGAGLEPLGFELAVHSPAAGVVVVTIAGELDMLTEARTHNCVHEGLRGVPEHLIIDLSRTSFLSARGVSMLINTGATAAVAGVQLLLTGVYGNRRVERTLEITGTTTSFDIRSGSIEQMVTDLTVGL